MSPQNVPHWRKDYFELVILRHGRHRRCSDVEWNLPSALIQGSSTCNGASAQGQEED